jgi:hypothetical protein
MGCHGRAEAREGEMTGAGLDEDGVDIEQRDAAEVRAPWGTPRLVCLAVIEAEFFIGNSGFDGCFQTS